MSPQKPIGVQDWIRDRKAEFEAFDQAGFDNWLKSGLDYNDRKDSSALDSPQFEPLYSCYGGTLSRIEDTTDLLLRINDDFIPESKKTLFQQAIINTLSAYADEPDKHHNSITTLYTLMVKLDMEKGGKELVRVLDNSSAPWMTWDVLSAVMSLYPSPEATETARGVLNSPHFNENLLLSGVQTLLRHSQPDEATDIIRKYLPRMTELRKVKLENEQTSGEFDKYIGKIIGKLSVTTKHIFLRDTSHPPQQQWFFDAVIASVSRSKNQGAAI